MARWAGLGALVSTTCRQVHLVQGGYSVDDPGDDPDDDPPPHLPPVVVELPHEGRAPVEGPGGGQVLRLATNQG